MVSDVTVWTGKPSITAVPLAVHCNWIGQPAENPNGNGKYGGAPPHDRLQLAGE